MMALKEKLSLMRDLLERMTDCCEDWQSDTDTTPIYADVLRRDLTDLRRLCDSVVAEQSAAVALLEY